MKVTVEDRSSVKKVLCIEIAPEDVSLELTKAYDNLKKTVKIKGFRPGKTPRSVLEGMYRKDVHADVSSRLIQENVVAAIKETGLHIVGQPIIDPPELMDKSAYAFNAEVEVRPRIDDIEIKGLDLKKTAYAVSDEELDRQLDMVRKNLAEHRKIEEERPVRADDIVVIDYEGFQDGTPHKDTKKTENFSLQVGRGQVVGDLDQGLVGLRTGEEKTIDVHFPDDYFNKALAGQKLVFKVKLNEIREEILPELDDAFAKSVGDQFETLGALKDKIHDNLKNGYDKRAEQELNEQIFQHLLKKTEFEVPDAMVASELEHIINDAEKKFSQSNRKLEDVGLSREMLAEKYRATAEKQVRRLLILDKVIKQEKLVLSDEELDQGFQDMADSYNQPVEQLKKIYDMNKDGLAFFKHALLEKKALKLIIENSVITQIEPERENKSPDVAPAE